jgi:peptide deformylase
MSPHPNPLPPKAGEGAAKRRVRARILRITQLGEPVLRRASKNLPLPLSRAHHRLIDDMIITMKRAKGVGIAAPQVGVGLNLFIVAPEPSVRYPKAPRMAPVAMINPKVVRHSSKTVTDWEGCLSIPGLRGRVPRYHALEIEFTARDGRRLRGKLTGFVARIFQHEYDHICGRVYLDRVNDTRTFMTEAQYRKLRHA